jgi:hypothetical protein
MEIWQLLLIFPPSLLEIENLQSHVIILCVGFFSNTCLILVLGTF